MIIANRKPIDEIMEMIKPFKRVLISGCGGCVTVCLAGGEKEVALLAEALTLACKKDGIEKEFVTHTVTRQCDDEFLEPLREKTKDCDVQLSMACGVGVNFLNDRIPEAVTVPAVNTLFMGANEEAGLWHEKCAGCGNCVLHTTGGICPIARCSKSLLNGPCGGTTAGKCEISPDVDCGWALIVERMEKLGRLDEMDKVEPPKDWSTSPSAGARRLVREELQISVEGGTDE